MSPEESTLDWIEEKIAAYHIAILGIFADPERGLPGFSYSIGLQDRGWPEILISGLHPRHAHSILNDIAAMIRKRGAPLKEGEILEGMLEGGFLMRARELSPLEVGANLILACRRSADLARKPPRAFQLIYQDPEHRWPEDPGYSCPMALLLAQEREETRQ